MGGPSGDTKVGKAESNDFLLEYLVELTFIKCTSLINIAMRSSMTGLPGDTKFGKAESSDFRGYLRERRVTNSAIWSSAGNGCPLSPEAKRLCCGDHPQKVPPDAEVDPDPGARGDFVGDLT